MRNNSNRFNRRAYLKTTGLATAGMVGLAGCTSESDLNGDEETDDSTEDGDSAFGTLSTSITDQPNDIGDFEELIVTIDGIWIKPESTEDDEEDADEELEDNDDQENEEPEDNGDGTGEEDEDDEADDDGDEDEEDENSDDEAEDVDQGEGRRYIEFDEPQEADLVDLQGDNTALIDETDVEVGDYQFLQLNVSNTEGILVEDGSEADVETPGNAPLQFNAEFEIRADEQTRFIADFAPQRRGQQGSYIVRPVASGTTVLYGDEEYTADDDTNGEGDDDNGEPNGDDDANRNETSSPNGDNETGTQNGPENGE